LYVWTSATGHHRASATELGATNAANDVRVFFSISDDCMDNRNNLWSRDVFVLFKTEKIRQQ
ncbi:MAG: hypothetical protein QF704_17550, partial [Anaerolineales bacterium]|nr:hypothetical protein [Anaerolineales bacterium]